MAASRPRVGIVVNALDVGGAERLVTDLAIAWRSESRMEFVFFVLRGGGALEPAVRSAGWEVHSLESGFRLDPRAVPRLRTAIRQEHISLLHAHLPRSGIQAGLVARRHDIPLLYTEHNLLAGYDAPIRIIHRATLSRYTAIVAVSQPVREGLVAQYPTLADRISVIENGVDVTHLRRALPRRDVVRASLGIGQDELLVLNVGNLRPPKNQRGLIRAFSALSPALRSRTRLVIVGRDDGEGDELGRLVAKAGLGTEVRFAGSRQDVPDLLAACDVFAMSSLVEGLPIALLEAGALGKPLVATRVGGIPDVIVDGRTGRLVEPGDDAALARALEQTLESREDRDRLGAEAERIVRSRFSIQNTAAAYADLYARHLAPCS